MNDPINPAHYGGTACAEIGEHLTANSYQVLKYNWRLGKKDAATIEVGKSLWYLDREINLCAQGIVPVCPVVFPTDDWFEQRLAWQPAPLRSLAHHLIAYNRTGRPFPLLTLRDDLNWLLKTLKENN